MKIVNEMRRRRPFEEPKKANLLPVAFGVIIAFGLGAIGVTGLVKPPHYIQARAPTVAAVIAAPAENAADIVSDAAVRRTGRAESAPLLKRCIPLDRLGIEPGRAAPGELYRLLQSASSITRIAAIAGIRQNAVDETQFAALWADVADCVYRQNGWAFCDPDNRALAVEAANTLVRQVAAAARSEKAGQDNARPAASHGQERAYALRNAQAVKGRVLSALRQRVAEGRLAAADFGLFAPQDVLQAVRESKVAGNACAARS